ncbi:EcsC family protein [Pontibacter sp. E15-1]|uniref:EcsC family protein n=1 Tax=Pontibacter sp. E15-1 TaxID=2919918 RepID=UPI001F4FFDC0|nr:EcsC family protein [Pontibacter sp. E15-1]MCJ8165072.1 EcsC family protein [Pontibacter sp. E15-1]
MQMYEERALQELAEWQQDMQRPPSLTSKLTSRVQQKLNGYIPEKVHALITSTIKQMIRGVLFGAEYTTRIPEKSSTLLIKEALVQERIRFYKRAAAAEGGITGMGGILMGFADFPLLLGLKLKLLYEIAALYGYDVADYRERLYLLHVFQLAFSSQEQRARVYRRMEHWNERKAHLPDDIHQYDWRTFQQEYRDYIDIPKMAQMIPIVGAPIGALVNYKLLQKLGDTAMNAYRMRWHDEQHLIG